MLLKPWHWMRLQGHEMDREEDRGPCFQGTSTLGDWGEEEEPTEKTEEGASSKLKGKGGVQYNESQMQRFKEANAMSVSNPAEQPNKRKKIFTIRYSNIEVNGDLDKGKFGGAQGHNLYRIGLGMAERKGSRGREYKQLF